VMPLAISNGAGSGSQHAIGTGVIGGMLTATFLAVFMIPMFFVIISKKDKAPAAPAGGQDDAHGSDGGGSRDGGNAAAPRTEEH
jgi:multidrug efflux pump